MGKKEALVDACFFNRLTDNGKCVEDFKIILNSLEYTPVVHPYIASYELSMFAGFQQLVSEGFIRVAEYSDFLLDESDRKMYEGHFYDLYKKIKDLMIANNGAKQLEELVIPKGISLFDYHKSGMSLGDVHLILMAVYMRIPIILTEDSDITILKSLIASVINSSSFSLEIINLKELLMRFATQDQEDITKKDLVAIVKRTGLRGAQSEIKQKWNESHTSK